VTGRPNVAVIFHSRNGTIYALARAAAHGAARYGARVRLLRVEDDEPVRPDIDAVRPADLDDLRWAHGIVLGSPTYYGNVSFPVKRFIDGTTSLWTSGELADRAVTGLTSATSRYGGQEATLLALYHSMYHWGSLIVAAGHADPALVGDGANPYGVSVSALDDGSVSVRGQDAAAALGARLAGVAGRLATSGASMALTSGRARVAVIYQHSAAGTTRALAAEIADGARVAGAQVRLRRVGDVIPARESLTDGGLLNDGGSAATLADLDWADAFAFGTSTFTGGAAPQLAHFLCSAERLRAAGRLDGKLATAFVTTEHEHAGTESALLALYNTMHHWGAVIVPPGYTDPCLTAAGGNPYGTSCVAPDGALPDAAVRRAARFQGGRLATAAARLSGEPDAARPDDADLTCERRKHAQDTG
jgi:multimeric flavodoxin WrbA